MMAHVRDCHFKDSSIDRGTGCRSDSEREAQRGETGAGTDQAKHKHKQRMTNIGQSYLFVFVCLLL